MRTAHSGLLAELKTSGVPDALGDAIAAFKETFTVSATGHSADPTATDAAELGEAAFRQDPRDGVI